MDVWVYLRTDYTAEWMMDKHEDEEQLSQRVGGQVDDWAGKMGGRSM